MKKRKIVAILLALLVVRVAVMFASPVFDKSESRYATLAVNMARTGDFLVPHFIHDGVYQSFDGKPPLVFQLGGLFVRAFGENEFAVRLPSLLAALGALAILFFVLRRLADAERATSAVLVAATSATFFADAGFCMTDMALMFCVAGALLLEALFNERPSRPLSLAVAALLAVGMLVKGPVALVLFGLPVLVDACVNRRWKVLARHSWVLGTLLFFMIAAPWYVLAERRTPGFLSYFFIHENFLRFVTHDYGDRYGAGREFFRGMSVVWLAVVMLPWTPLALMRLFRRRRDDGERRVGWTRPDFLTIAALSIVGFWCLTSRVPLAYLVPAIPVASVWIALRADPKLVERLFPPAAAIACVVLVGGLSVARLTSNKLSGRGYRDLAADYPANATFAAKKWTLPYSAEFYLGGRLHAMPQPGDVLIDEIERNGR